MFVTSYTHLISPTGDRGSSGEMTVFMPSVWPAAMNSRPFSSLCSMPRSERRAARTGTSAVANPAAKIPSPQRSICAATGPSPAGSSSSNSDIPACTTVRHAPRRGLVSSRTRWAPRMSQNVSAAASRSRTARSIRSTRVSMGASSAMCGTARRQYRGDALYNLAQDQAAFSSRSLCHMMGAGSRRRPLMTTTSDIILLDISDGIATITLNRPDRLNALSGELLDMLPGVIQKVADDEDARCLILTGAGRGFCAGGDIAGMASGETLPQEDPVTRLRRNEEASRLLHDMPKPTIAMINGPAAGAGLRLALACDIRIAGESARLGTAFARVGFSGDFGGTWMLQRLVGPAKARELERIGMVNRTVPDDRLREETMTLARRIASGPPIALARMKQNLNLALTSSFATLLDAEAEGMIMTGLTQDHRDAARAFLEKRQPTFHGR